MLNSWSEPPFVTSSSSVPSNRLGFQLGGIEAAAVISIGTTANHTPSTRLLIDEMPSCSL